MSTSANVLWQRLRDQGIVEGDRPQTDEDSPAWFIRVMLGISGWLAAGFLLGFVAIGLDFIVENNTLAVIAGGLVMVVAFALFRSGRNEFVDQFGLVLSLTGQALFLFGIIDALDWDGAVPWLIGAALQLAVIAIMANFIQRLLAGYFFIAALSVALSHYGAVSLALAFAAIMAVCFWLNEFRWNILGTIFRPAAYGITIALIQVKGQIVLGDIAGYFLKNRAEYSFFLPTWFDEIVLGLLLAGVTATLMRRYDIGWGDTRMLLALLMATAVAAVSFEAPGISIGLVLTLLGFGAANRILLGIGIASLLLYISAYYYSLEATLLAKSTTLAATGIVLLAVRWIAMRWLFSGTVEADHE